MPLGDNLHWLNTIFKFTPVYFYSSYVIRYFVLINLISRFRKWKLRNPCCVVCACVMHWVGVCRSRSNFSVAFRKKSLISNYHIITTTALFITTIQNDASHYHAIEFLLDLDYSYHLIAKHRKKFTPPDWVRGFPHALSPVRSSFLPSIQHCQQRNAGPFNISNFY